MSAEQPVKQVCPRCKTTDCFGPDDKSCSDIILVRYKQANAALTEQVARLEGGK